MMWSRPTRSPGGDIIPTCDAAARIALSRIVLQWGIITSISQSSLLFSHFVLGEVSTALQRKKKKIGDKCLPSFFQKKKRTGIISVGHSQQPRSFGLFQKACRSSVWEQFRSDIFRGWRRAADGNEFGCLSLPAEEQLETVCERSFSWKPLNSPHHVFDANTTFLHNRIETLHHNVWDPTAGIRSLSQPQQH